MREMGLFETLIHPDREDDSERALVAQAANLLQVGEFQVLQLAYRKWYDEDLPKALIDRLFHSYMLYNEVPHWARQYARHILMLDKRGELDDLDPAYHIYDSDYHGYVPNGVRRFVVAVSILVICVGGGLWLAHMATGGGGYSVLPPYFNESDFKDTRPIP